MAIEFALVTSGRDCVVSSYSGTHDKLIRCSSFGLSAFSLPTTPPIFEDVRDAVFSGRDHEWIGLPFACGGRSWLLDIYFSPIFRGDRVFGMAHQGYATPIPTPEEVAILRALLSGDDEFLRKPFAGEKPVGRPLAWTRRQAAADLAGVQRRRRLLSQALALVPGHQLFH